MSETVNTMHRSCFFFLCTLPLVAPKHLLVAPQTEISSPSVCLFVCFFVFFSQPETHILSYISPTDHWTPFIHCVSNWSQYPSTLSPVCTLVNHMCIQLTHAGDLQANIGLLVLSSLLHLSTINGQFSSTNFSSISWTQPGPYFLQRPSVLSGKTR